MESKHIHFVGIGGIGMSALARLYLHEGATVSGSDAVESENTKKLETEGATVSYDQKGENITDGMSLVVYTEAMPHSHPELEAARAKGIKTINYFEALGEIANEYYLIAVAGTHGKTTTTAMLADILEEASFDPSVVVGSLRSKTGSNYRAGKSKYFVVEACEYKRDFLTLRPDVLVITNLEHEHVDYYKDLEDVQSAFAELAQRVPKDGAIIAATTDLKVKPILKHVKARVVDYRMELPQVLSLKQPGLYNRMNAAAARATALFLGIEKDDIVRALDIFAGTQRRFEYKGDVNGSHVYDDYAHHPTEIVAAISGARELYPTKKLVVVWEGHTYSRVSELFDEFVSALSGADRVIVVPIYAAREENVSGVSGEDVVEKLIAESVSAQYFHTLEAAALTVTEQVGNDWVVLIMGAGKVTAVADMLT